MVAEVGDGGGKCSSLVDGVLINADHQGSRVVEGFPDLEMEAFMDDAFHRAWRDSKFFGDGFVVNVFDVFMGDGFAEEFRGAFFGE